MRVDAAITEFLSGYFSTHNRTKKTKAAYSIDLAQFLAFLGGEFDLLSLSGALIERWAAYLREEGYSPASSRRKIVVLKVFCSYWVRKGDLLESPFWRVKLSLGRVEQLPCALTEREMRSLLARARRDYASVEVGQNGAGPTSSQTCSAASHGYRTLRNLALVDLLFATGMRVGEVSALDVRDFFVREAVFRVQGKGGRDRLVRVCKLSSVSNQSRC